MTLLVFAAEGFLLVSLFLQLASVALVWRRPRSRRAFVAPDLKVPRVTILRPVCGLENNIEETLRSGLALDHDDYETIFCVASPADPIVPVLERLAAEHPQREVRILFGDDRISGNPKLNNLVKGWAAASAEWIVMTDSNVLMPPDYLHRLFASWTPGTGLVCSPPSGSDPEGVFSELECAFLNTFQARWQLAADSVGLGFAQGKTMLWRRDVLDAGGGIAALAREMAEDAAATKVVRSAGLAVRLVPEPFPQPLGQRRFGEVWRRQIRWARLRRASFKLLFYPEILAGGFWPIVAASFLAWADAMPEWGPLALAVVWYGAEAELVRQMRWPLSWRMPFLWLLRDAMLPVLWVAAIAGSDFTWRGNAMTVRRDEDEPISEVGTEPRPT